MAVFDLATNPRPRNKTAALVVYGKNYDEIEISDESGYTKNVFWSESPFPTIKPLPDELFKNESFLDFTNKKIGYFTVIGYLDKRYYIFKSKGSSRWVCRCKCGIYEIKRTEALKCVKKLSSCMCHKCKNNQFANMVEIINKSFSLSDQQIKLFFSYNRELTDKFEDAVFYGKLYEFDLSDLLLKIEIDIKRGLIRCA